MAVFRNYVYDAERMYKEVKDLASPQDPIHTYFKKLQDDKIEYERQENIVIQAKRRFYTGDSLAWGEMDRAKRKLNSVEMDMHYMFIKIQERTRRINTKNN